MHGIYFCEFLFSKIVRIIRINLVFLNKEVENKVTYPLLLPFVNIYVQTLLWIIHLKRNAVSFWLQFRDNRRHSRYDGY